MIWQDITLSFVAGWLACRAWCGALRAYRAGRSVADALNPHRAERRANRIPRISEVGQ